MLVPHSATRLAAPVTLTQHRVEYGVIHPLTPSSSYVTVLYYIVLYCTLLYCIILYCIILYCTVLYLEARRAPKSPLEELEVGGHRPPYLLVCYIVLCCPVLLCFDLLCCFLLCHVVLFCPVDGNDMEISMGKNYN